MANAWYDHGRQSFLEKQIDWLNDNIKCVLVDQGAYTVDLVNHQFLSDIPGGARIATSGNLASKTTNSPVGGVADAADVTFTAVSGVSIEYLVIYQDTGAAGTSRLILFLDTVTGLPATPSGADWVIQWDNGVNRIVRL